MNQPEVDAVLAPAIRGLTPAELLERAEHHARWARQCRRVAQGIIKRQTTQVPAIVALPRRQGGAR